MITLSSLAWYAHRACWWAFDYDLADLRSSLHLLNQSLSHWRPRMVLANVSVPWIHTDCPHYSRLVVTLSELAES